MEARRPGDRATPTQPTLSPIRIDDEAGASMVEYAFLLAGVALVVVIAAETFGMSIGDLLLLPMAWL